MHPLDVLVEGAFICGLNPYAPSSSICLVNFLPSVVFLCTLLMCLSRELLFVVLILMHPIDDLFEGFTVQFTSNAHS